MSSVDVPASTNTSATTPTAPEPLVTATPIVMTLRTRTAMAANDSRQIVLQQSVTVKEHGKLEVDLGQSLPGTRRQVAHREQASRFTRQDVHAFAVHRAHSVIH